MQSREFDLPLGNEAPVPAAHGDNRQLLIGTVKSANGLPVVGAAVTVSGGMAHTDIASMTNTEGRFSLELHPGTYVVTVNGGGRSTDKRVAVSAAGSNRCDIVLT